MKFIINYILLVDFILFIGAADQEEDGFIKGTPTTTATATTTTTITTVSSPGSHNHPPTGKICPETGEWEPE